MNAQSPVTPHALHRYNRSSIVNGWYASTGGDALRAASASESVSADELIDSSYILSAQRMLDDAAMSVMAERAGRAPSSAGLDLTLKMYPRVRAAEGETLSTSFGSLFFTMGLSLPMFATVVRVVSEKEHHVAGAMRSIGVAPSASWFGYWSQSIIVACITSLTVYIGGFACQIPLFLRSDGGVLLIVVLAYTLNMAALSFLLCSLTHQVRTATMVSLRGGSLGPPTSATRPPIVPFSRQPSPSPHPCFPQGAVVVLLAGAAVAVLAQSPATNPAAFFFWEPAFPSAVRNLLLLVLPPLNLIKILSDAGVRTARPLVFNTTLGQAQYADGESFDWGAFSTFSQNRTASVLAVTDGGELFTTPPPVESLVSP